LTASKGTERTVAGGCERQSHGPLLARCQPLYVCVLRAVGC